MPNLLTRLFRREPEITRFSTADYIRAITSGGLMQPYGSSPVSYAKGKPAERTENSFTGYIYGAYKANPIVFGAMMARSSVFSEARFMWRKIEDGRPGDLFSTDALDILRAPWPNCTTGELLTRMIQDVDLAGNFYCVNEDDRLRRLRPDWVQIVLSGDPRLEADVDVMGYVYTPGGPDAGDPVSYLPDAVSHWSPIPDPDALYRGMSWLTPVVREIQGDQAAIEHKLAFFKNGAVLGPIVRVPAGLTPTQFKEFIQAANDAQAGTDNAYKMMFLGGGADVTLSSSTMQQLDFKGLSGSAETRICVASRVPAVIAGVSEGLAGSSLNAGNYASAKRSFADGCLRPLWRSACAALASILDVPADAELWYDERDIAFLRDDEQDIAAIQQTVASTLSSLITTGYEPDSSVAAVVANDFTKLVHSGLTSVQLLPPGTDTNGDGAPDDTDSAVAEDAAGEEYAAALDEFRAQLWDERDEIVRAAEDIDADDDDEPGQFAGEIVRKYYDVRFTSGPKGGQFRKISDRVGAALNDFLHGDGEDDDPLEKFTQPQLKQAAKDFGVDTPPRAGKKALKLAIFNDAKGRRATKAAEPARRASFTLKGGGPSADEVREIEVENKIREVYRDLPENKTVGVEMADLRERLAEENVRGVEFEAAIKRLVADGSGFGFAQENQQQLTPRDRVSAVKVGMRTYHRLKIDDPSPRLAPKSDSKLRDLDVGVYVESKPGSKIYLRRESDGKPGTTLQSFDDLDALASWADEHGESELGRWARLESTGDAPKVTDRIIAPSRTKKALDTAEARKAAKKAAKKAAPAKTAAKPSAVDRGEVSKVASAFHEDWRKTRLQDDGTFEPRVKKTKDQAWIDAHGTDDVDIANTTYDELPDDWKAENAAAAQVAARILKQRGGKVDLSDEKTRLAVGEEIHQAWLSRNPQAKGGDLDVPFAKLPRAEQDKDTDQLKVAMGALGRSKPARSKKSRTQIAPGYPDRASVPDAKADPSTSFPGYDPPSYTAPSVLANDRTRKPGGWADPADPHKAGPFTSYEGPVEVDAKGRPVNPVTRTGIQDRGLLGKWGANYAADPIITRRNPDTGQLQMAAIRRGDSGQWAIPGGMVDEGEAVSATLGREFREETGADLDMSGGREVYKGFVDDPRNTDNAWMETTAVHLHLTPEQAAAVQFKGPDDPGEITDVRWAPVDDEFLGNLYASHGEFVREALRQMEADPPAKKATPRKAAPPAPGKAPDLASLDTEARRDALDLVKIGSVKEPGTLKAMLRERGLPVSGTKRELVDRLVSGMATRSVEVDEDDIGRAELDDDLDDEILRMAVDGDEFQAYWTRGKGLKRWATKPHPWRTLHRLLLKHPGIHDAEGLASHYFKVVFGIWPGERKGDNPVGPG